MINKKVNENAVVQEGLFGSSTMRPSKTDVRVMVQTQNGRPIGAAMVDPEDYSYYREGTAVPASSILDDKYMQRFNLGYFDYIRIKPLGK